MQGEPFVCAQIRRLAYQLHEIQEFVESDDLKLKRKKTTPQKNAR